MFHHRKPTWYERLRSMINVLTTPVPSMTGPCGHEVQGDSRSWHCPTCGSSGSSSS